MPAVSAGELAESDAREAGNGDAAVSGSARTADNSCTHARSPSTNSLYDGSDPCRRDSVLKKNIPWWAAVSGAALVIFAQLIAAAERDPHRPACQTTRCSQIKSFLRAHYCGESPFGNGPEDGCEILRPEAVLADLQVIALWSCDWDEQKREQVCRQQGHPPTVVRTIVAREMLRLGVPAGRDAQVNFTVLRSASAGLSVAEGSYYALQGESATFCQVVVTVDDWSRFHVLRKHQCHK